MITAATHTRSILISMQVLVVMSFLRWERQQQMQHGRDRMPMPILWVLAGVLLLALLLMQGVVGCCTNQQLMAGVCRCFNRSL
jgi:uncharacterized membrane protein YidH (DUF202 family)